MIVHFTTSKQDIKVEYENIAKIAGVVKGLGHTFAREWWDDEYKRAQTGDAVSELDWKKINEENMGALARADVVIIEATGKTFSVGFQLANAIQQKKPTLVLTKNNSLSGTFGSGISSDFVRFANYDNDEDIAKAIGDFLRDNTIDTKDMRFNFFINRPIYNYLRWASFKTGKTKAEILRELVEREIENREP
jgi:hypothetical protein